MKQPIKKRTSITIKNKSKKSTAPKVKATKRAVHHPKQKIVIFIYISMFFDKN
jgi:hypothetical protein